MLRRAWFVACNQCLLAAFFWFYTWLVISCLLCLVCSVRRNSMTRTPTFFVTSSRNRRMNLNVPSPLCQRQAKPSVHERTLKLYAVQRMHNHIYVHIHTYIHTLKHTYIYTQILHAQFISLFVVNVPVLYLGVCYVCVALLAFAMHTLTHTYSYQPVCPLHPSHCSVCICVQLVGSGLLLRLLFMAARRWECEYGEAAAIEAMIVALAVSVAAIVWWQRDAKIALASSA